MIVSLLFLLAFCLCGGGDEGGEVGIEERGYERNGVGVNANSRCRDRISIPEL